MELKHNSNYVDRRKEEYPPLVDYIDAMYWTSKGDPSKLNEYLAKVEKVKAKYPKPKKQGE